MFSNVTNDLKLCLFYTVMWSIIILMFSSLIITKNYTLFFIICLLMSCGFAFIARQGNFDKYTIFVSFLFSPLMLYIIWIFHIIKLISLQYEFVFKLN